MRNEIVVALVMLLISIGGSIATRNDRKWSVFFLFLASVAGSLAAGMGIRFREIVEGPFGFLDSMLCVCAASVLVAVLERSGAFGYLADRVFSIRSRTLRAFGVLFLIALPSMLTGFAGSSLLTTGRLFRERVQGADPKKVHLTVCVGAFIGVILPPNCIPAMIAANGAGSVLPTPYAGFFLPLLVIGLPAFIVYALMRRDILASVEVQEKSGSGSALVSLIVLAVAGIAVLFDGVLPNVLYLGGNTLVFFVSSIIVIAVCRGFGGFKAVFDTVSDGLMKAVVPMAVVFSLGSFIEVSSMTGVRGLYSMWILPYNVVPVMLVLMAAALVIGYFFSTPVPAFLITYAVFPIGWLANTVPVAGLGAALAVVALITRNGGIVNCRENGLRSSDVLREVWLPVVLVLAVGTAFVVFGDSLTFLVR
ncbi:MAG: hypothetical protein IIU49_06065 [Spirochaetales bacterium]|nr:hypothetical protein [Spirochaetales bacterium]